MIYQFITKEKYTKFSIELLKENDLNKLLCHFRYLN